MNPDKPEWWAKPIEWNAPIVEWGEAWERVNNYVGGTYTVNTTDTTPISHSRKHVCVLCGDLDASPVCEECRGIFNEFKAYFKKRQFKELMDELTEMGE